MRPSLERLKIWASQFFAEVPEASTLTLSLPWGRVPLSRAFSTGRSLKYLQYCLDQWNEGRTVYLMRLFELEPPPHPSQRPRKRSSSSVMLSTRRGLNLAAHGPMNRAISNRRRGIKQTGEAMWP